MLEVKNLCKKFGKHQVLNDLTFSMDCGIYGLLGANGAGKTTLLRTLAGVYPIQTGEVRFEGVPIQQNQSYACSLGYLPQSFGLFKRLTAREMLRYFAELKELPKETRDAAIDESLARVNLADKAKAKVGTLSGGMVRRLGIAQAILGNPKVILLDEPTAGLDPEERSRFKTLLMHLPKDSLILLSTHIVEDVESICSRILLMDAGKLVGTGDTASIRAIAEGKVYCVPARLEAELREPFDIVKREQINGEDCLRVLSPTEQQGTLEAPTVEDGYLCRKRGFA